MPSRGRHECKFCDKTFARATDQMTHLTIDHADKVAYVPYSERWKHRDFTCGKCYSLMATSENSEYIKECRKCGYNFDIRKRDVIT